MVAAAPDRDVPISCPVIASATDRRSSSDKDLPTTGYMAPVDSTSKTCSGVISRNASGDGASLKAGLPWQLKHRCWKRPNPSSTGIGAAAVGAAIAGFSPSLEPFSLVVAADSDPYALAIDANSTTDSIATHCGDPRTCCALMGAPERSGAFPSPIPRHQ